MNVEAYHDCDEKFFVCARYHHLDIAMSFATLFLVLRVNLKAIKLQKDFLSN